MRYSSSEKYEIIQLVQQSSLSVTCTQARLDIHKSTFYNWLGRYHDGGLDALDDKKPQPSMAWNRVPTEHRPHLLSENGPCREISGFFICAYLKFHSCS
jgi:putative transposase